MYQLANNCKIWAHNIFLPLPIKGMQPDLDDKNTTVSFTRLMETEEGATLYSERGITLLKGVKELPSGVSWEGKENTYFMLPKCKHFCASPATGYKVTKLDIFSKKPDGIETVELLGYFVAVETEELT